MINFIGLGAQKAGTSWLYACLYEHPEVCAPIKEIHYFSRDRFKNGQAWYESHFSNCKPNTLSGEFSTSYLSSVETPKRIAESNPDAKLIAVLRNPIDRVYSEYRNAIKAGEISKRTTFSTFIREQPEALEKGLYAKQLYRYYEYFSRVQLHAAIYEDSKKDPLAFVKSVYEFLEIDSEFVPKMLKQYINVTRTPRFVFIDRIMHKIAEGMRKVGLDKIVWFVKSSGVTDKVRSANTEPEKAVPADFDREALRAYYQEDVKYLSQLLRRDLSTQWNI